VSTAVCRVFKRNVQGHPRRRRRQFDGVCQSRYRETG
jgi:hypothetical protein